MTGDYPAGVTDEDFTSHDPRDEPEEEPALHIAFSSAPRAPTVCGAGGSEILRVHHVHVQPGAKTHDGKPLCPHCLNPQGEPDVNF